MITHSSFCNESVVISYGIAGTNIQQFSQKPNNMTEKFQKFIDHKFYAYAHAVDLIAKCHDRENQCADAASGSANGTIKENALFNVLASETACTIFRLTPKGYLKAIWVLFKIAFIEKKFKRGLPFVGAIFIK